MRKAILMAVLVALSSVALADTILKNPTSKLDEKRPHIFYGVGMNSCGQYLSEREKDGNKLTGIVGLIYTSWFHGYASGFNSFASRQVTGELEQPTVVAYFDKWCRDTPLGTVLGAASCLVEAKGGAPLHYTCKP